MIRKPTTAAEARERMRRESPADRRALAECAQRDEQEMHELGQGRARDTGIKYRKARVRTDVLAARNLMRTALARIPYGEDSHLLLVPWGMRDTLAGCARALDEWLKTYDAESPTLYDVPKHLHR